MLISNEEATSLKWVATEFERRVVSGRALGTGCEGFVAGTGKQLCNICSAEDCEGLASMELSMLV